MSISIDPGPTYTVGTIDTVTRAINTFGGPQKWFNVFKNLKKTLPFVENVLIFNNNLSLHYIVVNYNTKYFLGRRGPTKAEVPEVHESYGTAPHLP